MAFSVRLTNLVGLAPRIEPRLLSSHHGQIAHNVELYSGAIRPLRAPKFAGVTLHPEKLENSLCGVSYPEARTIKSVDGRWYSWDSDVKVVRGFGEAGLSGRFFYSEGGKIYWSSNDGGSPDKRPIGVDFPENALTISIISAGDGTSPKLFTSWFYTFVTAENEESAPSPLSTPIQIFDGTSAVLDGFARPPTALATPVKIRLYQSSYNAPDGVAPFLLVDELPITTTSYTATKKRNELGYANITTGLLPPPKTAINGGELCVAGIVSMGSNYYFGYGGREGFFSEPGRPYAFPDQYRVLLDYPIVAAESYAGIINNELVTHLVIATTGYVYVAVGRNPLEAIKNLTKLPDPQPCVSARSMVSAPYGVIFASHDGLVRVGQGGMSVITRGVARRAEWGKMFNPSTIVGAVYDGRYFGFYSSPTGNQGFSFDYNDRTTGVDQHDKLVTFSVFGTAVHSSPEESFYFAKDNQLYQWGTGEGFLKKKWKSKIIIAREVSTCSAVKLNMHTKRYTLAEQAARDSYAVYYGKTMAAAGHAVGRPSVAEFLKERPSLQCHAAILTEIEHPEQLRVWVDGRLVLDRNVFDSSPVRMPKVRGLEFEIQVSGKRAIYEIMMATSMMELTRAGRQSGEGLSDEIISQETDV